MIDLALKAIDRIISLRRERINDNRKFIQDQISPIMTEMEIVHKNYIESFNDIIKEAESANDAKNLVSFVLSKKLEFEHIRVKIYSFAQIAQKSKHTPEIARMFFHSLARYFYYKDRSLEFSDYRAHFTEIISQIDQGSDLLESRQKLIGYIKECLDHSRSDWEELTRVYGECKLEMLK
jgi:hypothetical protein